MCKNPRDDERRGDDGRRRLFLTRGATAGVAVGEENSPSLVAPETRVRGRVEGTHRRWRVPGACPASWWVWGWPWASPRRRRRRAWFIIIFRSKSIDATRGIPAAAAAASPVSAPLFAVAAACAAAARFCCDPTCAMLLKNCSNSACEGVRPRRHRLPTISSTLAVRSIGERCVRLFRTTTTTTRRRARIHTRRSRPHRARRDATRARRTARGDSGGVSSSARDVCRRGGRASCVRESGRAREAKCRPQAPTASRQIKCRREAPC